MNTYLFKVTWYSEKEDEVITDHGSIAGGDYSEAAYRITKRFPDVVEMSLYETFCQDGFTFLNEDEYERMKKEDYYDGV